MKKQIIHQFITIFVIVTVISLAGCTPAQNQPGNPNATPGPNNMNTTQDDVNDTTPNTTRLNDNVGTNDFRRMAGNNTNNWGMGNNRNNGNLNNTNNNNRLGITGMGNPQNGTQGSNVNTTAQNIKSKLEARDDIENASCVISGDTALIGIDVKDGTNAANIKNDVINMVKNMVPGITNVAVTESPDLYERINKLSIDMQNGRTMQGLGEEFTEIVNRIIPTAR